jgi:hypothetical protein
VLVKAEGFCMDRREFTVALSTLSALCLQGVARAALAESDAAAGVRLALQRGVEAAVGLLGRADGFWANPQVRIGLPKGAGRAGAAAQGHRPG